MCPQMGWGAEATRMYTWDLKVIDEDGARLGIDVGGCLHGHELERCDAEGGFGIRVNSFYGHRDQMNFVLDLYRDEVPPGDSDRFDGALV